MKKEQKFLAITRHHLIYQHEGARRYLGGAPCLVAGGQDGPLYTYPDGRKTDVPIEYFLIPVTSKPDWDGTDLLFELQREVEAKVGNLAFGSAHCTLTIPQLHHNQNTDVISATQLRYANYQAFKGHASDRIIEVSSLDELFKAFAFYLPDEPPEIEVPKKVQEMMAKVPRGPLNGILVVAFDQQIAGSLAAEELARKGACIIKIERLEGGDPKRANSSKTAFNNFNAGKFSIAFDDSESDQKLKAELLRLADVIVDNRSTSAQERDSVLQTALANPNRLKPLIFCGISGFGRDSDRPAYDRMLQAESGMADFNGKLIPFPIIDTATGKEAASEIGMQLFARERMTPREAAHTPCIRIDISMIAVALGLMANQIATLIDTGTPQSTIVPFDLYETKDGRISIAVAKDDQYARLCEVLQTPEIAQFATNTLRLANKAFIEETLHKTLSQQPSQHWLELCTKNNIPAGPVINLNEALKSHGRQVVKVTTDGQLFVGSAAATNRYPLNPDIGSAPAHNANRDDVAALAKHLTSNASNSKALEHTHEVSATSPAQKLHRDYRFIDVHEVKFNQPSSSVSWAKGHVFSIKKTGKVKARKAAPNEVIDIIHIDTTTNTKTVSKHTAMEGDWIVITKFGDQYVLPDDTFTTHYIPASRKDCFKPNPELEPKKAIKITEDVSFMSPSGNISYIPKGGWLVEGSKGSYGIHPNNIKGNYEVAKWCSQEAGKEPENEGLGKGKK